MPSGLASVLEACRLVGAMDTGALIALCLAGAAALLVVCALFKALGATIIPSPNTPSFVPPPTEDVVGIAENELDAAGTPNAVMHLVKEWKLARKNLRQKRTALAKEMRAIRATHTERVRQQMPMLRGGGGFGKFVRGVQTAGRYAQRVQLAEDLAPHEHSLQALDHSIARLDECILAGERRILKFRAHS